MELQAHAPGKSSVKAVEIQASPNVIRASNTCAYAVLRGFQGSPRKIRLVTRHIAGKQVRQALLSLDHMRNKSAEPISKLLKAALDNAMQKNITGPMHIKHIFANKAHVVKRMQIKGRGRTGLTTKPYSHITVVLQKTEETHGSKS